MGGFAEQDVKRNETLPAHALLLNKNIPVQPSLSS